MKIIRCIAMMSSWAVLSCLTLAPVTFAADENTHKTHHSKTANSNNKNLNTEKVAVNKPMAKASVEQVSIEKMDNQIKAMVEMHERMMNAKTPEERKAHMAEHMKTMQGGMAMLNEMAKMCSTHTMDNSALTSTNLKASQNPAVSNNQIKGDEAKTCMKCYKHSHADTHGAATHAAASHGATKQQMMEKRMEMMETIMQMLIDRNETYDEYADRMLKK